MPSSNEMKENAGKYLFQPFPGIYSAQMRK